MIKTKEIKQLIGKGVDEINGYVSLTLGPRGRTIMLTDNMGKPFITKDGVSVAKKLQDEDPIINAIISIVREAAEKTAKEAGDGTTTTTILTSGFYKKGVEMLKTNTLLEVKELLGDLVDSTAKILEKDSKVITYKDIDYIKGIATISANNDDYIGEIVKDAFIKAGSSGVVLFELTDHQKDTVDCIEGALFNTGLISSDFFTDKVRKECKYTDALVAVVNNTIPYFKDIMPIMKHVIEQKKPLLLIANDFGEEVIRGVIRNNYQGNSSVLLIKNQGWVGNKEDTLRDYCAVTGAKLLNNIRMFSPNELGHCEKVISSFSDTVIYIDNNIESLKEREEELTQQIKLAKENNDPILVSLERRKAKLLGKLAVIKVGGLTESEIKEKYDRVEDAVCAVKAALNGGVVKGGGFAYRDIANKIKNNPFYTVLYEPLIKQCQNAEISYDNIKEMQGFDFKNMKKCNLINSYIIDPKLVILNSVQNAASTALSLLSIGGAILEVGGM